MPTKITRPYKLRKSWEDSKTQKASYAYLENAIQASDILWLNDKHFSVWKEGVCIYDPEQQIEPTSTRPNIFRRIINKIFKK